MKFIVQTVPDRSVTHLRELIPGLTVVTDYGGDSMKCFVNCMREAGNEEHIHFEDDIILTSNFRTKALNAIAEYPRKMISFFTLRSITETQRVQGRRFCMTQCFYMPMGMAAQVVRYYEKGWPREPDEPNAFDYMVADYLAATGQDYMLWYPSLVQHLDMPSKLGSRSRFRQSKIFEP